MAPFLVIAFLLALGVGIVVWHVTDPELNPPVRRRAMRANVTAPIDDATPQALEPFPTPSQTEIRK